MANKGTKCKCEFQGHCAGGYHANYSIALYSSTGEVVKPLRFFKGSCSKAAEICDVLQAKFPLGYVNYDNA